MEPVSNNNINEPLTEEISSQFKLQWLNATLKFIKNEKEHILKYPELTVDKIEFLQAMISGNNYDIGLGYRELYAPLWEAIKILGLKYEFKMRVQRSGDNTGYLFLEKVSKTPIEDVTSDADAMDSSYECDVTQKEHISKQYMTKIKKTIYSISPSIIKSSLQKLLEFVTDDEQASVVFDDLARNQVTFLQNVLGVLKRRESLEELFSPSCNSLMEKIETVVDKSCFRLELSSVTLNEETRKRHLMFKKVPQFGKKRTKKKACIHYELKLRSDNGQQAQHILANPTGCSAEFQLVPRDLRDSSHRDSKGLTEMKELHIAIANIAQDIKDKSFETRLKENKYVPPSSNHINGVNIVKPLITESSSNNIPLPTNNSTTDKPKESAINQIDTTGLSKVKVKLIEGLATPVESDIAIRMMKSMGWEGGALGAREGGITEPIMPAIHLVRKAGLGHVPQKEITFRTEVLQAILDLLKEDISISVTELKNPMSKKGKRYVTQLNADLKTRNDPGLTNKHEVVLARGIFRILRENPGVKVVIMSVKDRQIKLQKIVEDVNNVPATLREKTVKTDKQTNIEVKDSKMDPIQNVTKTETKPALTKEQIITEIEQPLTKEQIKRKLHEYIYQKPSDANNNLNGFLTINEVSALLSEKEVLNTKKLNLLKDRLFIMKHCLLFLISDQKNVTIDAELSVRSRRFVKNLCAFINKRKPSLNTSIENVVWNEIAKNIGSCVLVYYFDSPKSFSFTKLYRTDRDDNPLGNSISPKEVITHTPGNTQNTEHNPKMSLNINLPKTVQNDDINVYYFGNNSNGNTQGLKNGNSDANEVLRSQSLEKADSNTESNNSNIAMDVDNVASVELSAGNTDNTKGKTDNVASVEFDDVITIRIIRQIDEAMTAVTAKEIQTRIGNAIKNSKFEFLPALKCHGMNNDSLVYSCFNVNTYDWLFDLLHDYQIVEYFCDRYKMAVQIRTFDDGFDVFSWLHLYYSHLKIELWQLVEKSYTYSDGKLSLTVLMDADSFKFICDRKFRLFSGIDEVIFNVIVC